MMSTWTLRGDKDSTISGASSTIGRLPALPFPRSTSRASGPTSAAGPSVLCARDMGSCQNYGPFLGTQNIRCRIILRTIIWTTTRMSSVPNLGLVRTLGRGERVHVALDTLLHHG